MAKQKPKSKLIKPSTAKLDGKSYYECYYCGGRVNASQAVIKPIALQVAIKDKAKERTKHMIKYIERPFHLDCLQKYMKERGDVVVYAFCLRAQEFLKNLVSHSAYHTPV